MLEEEEDQEEDQEEEEVVLWWVLFRIINAREGGGVYSESYTREARFLKRWDQHAFAQRRI